MGEVRQAIKVTKCPTAFCAPSTGRVSREDQLALRCHDDKVEERIAERVRSHEWFHGVNTLARLRQAYVTAEELESLNV